MAKQALIMYYSQFDTTAKVASKIHDVTGADIVRIAVAADIFPNDMDQTNQIYQEQLKQHRFPKVVIDIPNLSYYDLLLIGGPVWSGNVSTPVISLLQEIQDYQGEIAPFSTGWSDTGDYQANFEKWAGKLLVKPGYHILTHATPHFELKTLGSWLRKL